MELFVFRVESEEELPEIISDFSLVVSEFIESNFAVASTNRLINEDKISVAVPRVWIGSEIEIILHNERTVLSEETSERRASWTTVKPDNKRIS